MEIMGCELIAKSIAARGIRFAFTVPSKRLDPLIAALQKEEVVEIVRANNETAAAAMADGYARRTRNCPAIITEEKGAALSQISAVTNAWADKIPLLSISLCSDDEVDFNKGVFREQFDQNGVFHAVTHWRKRINTIERFDQLLEEAIQKSRTHKMGPVHLDIPVSFLTQKVDKKYLSNLPDSALVPQRRIEPMRIAADGLAVKRVASMIREAKRPLLLFGGGINASGGHSEALQLMQRLNLPTATTMSGVGAVPIEHDLCLGGPSYTAGEVFHVAIQEADLVMAVGVGFSGLEGFGLPPLWSEKIRFIHIDISPFQFGLNVSPELSILGDAKTVLKQLIDELSEQAFQDRPEWEKWRKRLRVLKRERAKRLKRDASRECCGIHQGKMAQEMAGLPGVDDLLVVIDGGNTPLFAAMYAPFAKPYQAFFPFGMSALGAGIPYAIGVQLAAPEKRVALITGDGSFMYNVQELETIKRLSLPIIIIINNDSAWNMIRKMQDSLFARNYVGTLLPDIDYSEIAKGFGIPAKRISRPEEVAPTYLQAIQSKEPYLIDCVTDQRNIPDALLSFTLVEFEGSLKELDLRKLMRSIWMMRDQGVHRIVFLLSYIVKALLRFDPVAWIKGFL